MFKLNKLMSVQKRLYKKGSHANEYLKNLFEKYYYHIENSRNGYFICDVIAHSNGIVEANYRSGGYITYDSDSIVCDVKKKTELPVNSLIIPGIDCYSDSMLPLNYFKDSVVYMDVTGLISWKQNSLQMFINNVLSNFTNLKYLIFNGCALRSIPYNLPQSLVFLDVSCNYIDDFEALKTYPNLRALVANYISDNFHTNTKIKDMNDIYPNIEYLDIRNNKYNFDKNEFKNQFPNLKYLILNNNEIKYDPIKY